MRTTRRPVPARERGARAEQVVVEQRVDEGSPSRRTVSHTLDEIPGRLPVCTRSGWRPPWLADGTAGVRGEIADMVAPSARTTLSPVFPVEDGRARGAVQANRKRGKHVNVVTACGEAAGKIGDISARATSCEIRALGVHEQELQTPHRPFDA